MTKVSPEIQELVEDIFGKSTLEVGVIITQPKTGKLVEITGGSYWGTYGVSNFWKWREVMDNGQLSDVEQSGYGRELQKE